MTGFTLRAKLTLALLFVGLSSAFLVGLVAREILLRRFDEIQLSESFGELMRELGAIRRELGRIRSLMEAQAPDRAHAPEPRRPARSTRTRSVA